MDAVDQFLERYREQLLSRLSGIETGRMAALRESGDPIVFVDGVLDAWTRLPGESRRSPIRPGERTFWYALYTLEDLAEHPPAQIATPFENMLLRELAQARELLAARAELPQGKFATRPGEDPADFMEDELVF